MKNNNQLIEYLTNELSKQKRYREIICENMSTDNSRLAGALKDSDIATNEVVRDLRRAIRREERKLRVGEVWNI